jgi:hypothetical protein
MDYEHRVFRIKDEDHLQPSATASAPRNSPFVVFSRLWIGSSRPADNRLGLFRGNTMLCNVFDIPRVPSEFQGEPRNGILLYM